jgi:hypothetical protein
VSSAGSYSLKYDATAPQVSGVAADRPPDGGGWYSHPVTFTFAGTDGGAGIASCTNATYSGPDTAGASVPGTCSDNAGNTSGPGSAQLKYDATPPTVTGGTPDRKPDAHGWYNRPVTISFGGTDAGSGVASCSTTTYSGPDGKPALAKGTCTDVAGNTSAPGEASISYDATPPKLGMVDVAMGDRAALLRWQASKDATSIEVLRWRSGAKKKKRVYHGNEKTFRDSGLRFGVHYKYEVAAYDEADNAATKTVALVPRLGLLAPADKQRVPAPPLLTWTAVRATPQYNVQLYRVVRGKRQKILSAFPKETEFKLRKAWKFQGQNYVLEPGRYVWYAWPRVRGSGDRYGKLLGSREFVLKR